MKMRAPQLQQAAEARRTAARTTYARDWWNASVPAGHIIGLVRSEYLSCVESTDDPYGHLAPWKTDPKKYPTVGADCGRIWLFKEWQDKAVFYLHELGKSLRTEYIARPRINTADELAGLCPKCLERFAWLVQHKFAQVIVAR